MSEKITICKNCKMFFEHSESICYNCNRPTIETIYSNVFWNKCDENRKNEILSEFFVVDEIKNPECALVNNYINKLKYSICEYIESDEKYKIGKIIYNSVDNLLEYIINDKTILKHEIKENE